MGVRDDDGYNEWLEQTGADDSKETRGWYVCEDDERSQYIEDHTDWWNKF